MRDELTIVVAAEDAGFRRYAAAILGRAGHRVLVTTDRPWRMRRLVRARDADVVLLEGVDDTHGLGPGVGVVVVGGDVAKWGSAADLVAAVATAAGRRLRVV